MNNYISMHHPLPTQHHPSLHPVLPLPIPQTAQPTWATHATLDEVEHDHDQSDDSADDDGAGGKKDKQVRRRSSKACDQCRKSKCKCERNANPNEPCRNCVMLGTECTFLGPSRKRGPPKGYIDAIENRLHQCEALLGVLVNSPDPRAVSLLQDISTEPSAFQILERVTLSPYGSKGRKKRSDGQDAHSHSRGKAEKHSSGSGVVDTGRLQPFSKPIEEWQDGVGRFILDAAHARAARGEKLEHGSSEEPLRDAIRRRTDSYNAKSTLATTSSSSAPSGADKNLKSKKSTTSLRSQHSGGSSSPLPGRAHQQQVTEELVPSDSDSEDVASGVGQLSLNEHEQFRYHGKVSGLHILGRHNRIDNANEGGVWRFPQPRAYHRPMPTSNPSLFGLRSSNQLTTEKDDIEKEIRSRLPSREVQDHLLALFWTYVHPVIPVLDKEAVQNAWKGEMDEATNKSGEKDINQRTETVGDSPPTQNPLAPVDSNKQASTSATSTKAVSRVPLLLLLTMLSISARFSAESPPNAPDPLHQSLWDEGGSSALADTYMADARMLLNIVYSSSRPSTCQALLLLSYREIGVGAMAAAWLYVGMAVRMAQDLGMHRKAERWVWKNPSNSKDNDSHVPSYPKGVFSERERQVRKKIWYACVVMDKYVSTYIGRPLSIFETDYDTPLPSEADREETELWVDDVSEEAFVHLDGPAEIPPLGSKAYPKPMQIEPVQSHVLSCFNQSARLSSILAEIVIGIYSVKPPTHSTRQLEYIAIEEKLDKWLLDLPAHLRLDKFQAAHQAWQSQSARKRVSESAGSGEDSAMNTPELDCHCPCPPPQIFTLHMLYWCSVLLLHRPFIHARPHNANSPPGEHGSPITSVSHKPFDLCMTAAGHITSIVTMYSEHFCLLRSPAFFTYYIFSAGIMYVTALSLQPDNPQAGLGLQKCLDCLKKMERTWPSAGRQWELLHGSKLDPKVREADLARLVSHKGEQRHHKRAAEEIDAPSVKQQQQQQHRRLSAASELQRRHESGATVEPLRLTTSFSPALANSTSNLSNLGHGSRPTVNTMIEPSSATSDHPISTPFSPRPYHLGLDMGGSSQSPRSATGGLHSHNPASPRSLFTQYERWASDSAANFGTSQQQNVFASLESSQMTPSMSAQPPRLPTSSERMPAYWNEYNDSSMMGSSLYSLPLIADAMASGGVVGSNGANSGSFFSDADYPIFSDQPPQNNR